MEYSVNRKLKFDGKEYGPGGTVEMDEKQAAPLVKIGVLSKPEPKKKGK